jgi:hypothetical protein
MTYFEFCDSMGLEPDSFSALIWFESGEAGKDFVDFVVDSGGTREEALAEWPRVCKVMKREVKRTNATLKEWELVP